jgi:hypothetical protein
MRSSFLSFPSLSISPSRISPILLIFFSSDFHFFFLFSSYLFSFLLTYFPYVEKNKSRLMRSSCCLWILPCQIPPLSSCVCISLCRCQATTWVKHYRCNEYTGCRRIVGGVVLYAVRVVSKESMRLGLPRTSCLYSLLRIYLFLDCSLFVFFVFLFSPFACLPAPCSCAFKRLKGLDWIGSASVNVEIRDSPTKLTVIAVTEYHVNLRALF